MTDSLENLAFEYAEARNPGDTPWNSGFADGVVWGAGWMAALIGMADAIRAAHLCRSCIQIYSADDDGTCQKCGYPHGWGER